MDKIVQKMIGCLLLALCCLPGYSLETDRQLVPDDTISRSTRELRRQEMLKTYVQLLSDNVNKEKKRESSVLVLPVIGIHPSQLSYGVMAGVVNRTGGYIKFRHSFSKASDNGMECDDQGIMLGADQVRWYSGRTEKSRMALTGGILQRLWKPVYLYGGLGYGARTLSWETISGEWIRNVDRSFKGVEAEIGGILRFGPLVVSLGLQTNSFKYLETNVGLGVIF